MTEKEKTTPEYDWRIVAILFFTAINAAAIGFVFGYTDFWTWLNNELSEGMGALLGGLIGFSGLMAVAWWSGRQNTRAIIKSANLDRELVEIKRKKMVSENVEFLLGNLLTQQQIVEKIKTQCEKSRTNGKTESTLIFIRKNLLEAGYFQPAEYSKEANLFRGIDAATINACLNIDRKIIDMRMFVSIIGSEPSEQIEVLLRSSETASSEITKVIKLVIANEL